MSDQTKIFGELMQVVIELPLHLKNCRECKISKPKKDFRASRHQCRSCEAIRQKGYRQENPQYFPDYNRQYKATHIEEIKMHRTGYDANHKEERAIYQAQYAESHKEEIRVNQTNRQKKKRTEDPNFKLRGNMSVMINKALKRNNTSKNGSSITEYLPYTIIELRLHLESLFENWMNWNNYGSYSKDWDDNDPTTWTWNIDHKKPQSFLPYTSMEDDNFKKCWALDNLRPYSAKQNLLDSNRRED